MSFIFTVVLGYPLWMAIVLYPVMGALWASIYLPRSIERQVEKYAAWRQEKLGVNMTMDAKVKRWMDIEINDAPAMDFNFSPRGFIDEAREEFGLSRVGKLFISNLVLWPILCPYFLFSDYLLATFKKIVRWIEDFWINVLKPIVDRIYRAIVSVYDKIIKLTQREALEDMVRLNARKGGAS